MCKIGLQAYSSNFKAIQQLTNPCSFSKTGLGKTKNLIISTSINKSRHNSISTSSKLHMANSHNTLTHPN